MNIWHKIFNYSARSKNTPAAWIADLLSMDDISAIEYSTKKLTIDFDYHILHNTLLHNTQNIEALISNDEKTHNIVERITQVFVDIENTNENPKMRISNAAFLYHQQLFLIYLKLSQCSEELHQHQLHLFLARAFRNATQMLKWQHYSCQSTQANFWPQVASLFKMAEKFSLLNAKIQPYSNQDPISLSSAYIQACTLGSLENTN